MSTIQTATDTMALTICFAIVLACAVIFTAGWLACKPLFVSWMLMGLIVLDASRINLAFQYGIWFYPEDLVFFILLLACCVRFTLFAPLSAVPKTWWIIGAVQLLLVMMGLREFGSGAGVDFRGHFYLWITVAYFCSIVWDAALLRQFSNACLSCATILCLIVVYRWLMSAIDPVYAVEAMAFDTTGVRFRVVGSGAALMIALGFIVLLYKMSCGVLPLMQRLLLIPFFAIVLILQHRSVWVSLIAGSVCLLWAQRRNSAARRAMHATLVLGTPLALLVFLFGSQSTVLESVRSSADHALSLKEGTMVGRVLNWQELLAKWVGSHSPLTYLIGNVYGSGYNSMLSEDGTFREDMVPHNQLIHMLYRGGLIGLFCTLSLFVRLWRAAASGVEDANKVWAPLLLAALTAMYAYYVPYWATYGTGMFLGIAVSYFAINTCSMRRPACNSHPGKKKRPALPC
jgi:hypothetical protein